MKCQAFVTLSLPISYHDMFNTCKYVLENAKSIFIICLKNNVLNILSAHCVWGDLFEFRAVANNLWCLEYLKKIIFWGAWGRVVFDDFYPLEEILMAVPVMNCVIKKSPNISKCIFHLETSIRGGSRLLHEHFERLERT